MTSSHSKLPIAIVILLVLFVAGNVLDIASTLFVLPGEANPIYLITGSLWPLIILKVVLVGGIVYTIVKRRFSNETSYFVLVSVLVFLTVLLFAVAGRNAYHGLNTEETYVSPATGEPVTYVEYIGETTTPEERMQEYNYLALILYVIPLAILIVAFELYNRTKKHFEFEKIQQNGLLVTKKKGAIERLMER